MPMNLEDLDDLLKYADEHQGEPLLNKQQKQDIENGNNSSGTEIIPVTNNTKELLTAKGSNTSIGQLSSNMCSSGYQSISTQSSSPVETGLGPLEYKRQGSSTSNNSGQMMNPRNGPLKYQFGGTKATLSAVGLGKALSNGHSSQKSSSLTPSSSEERLSEDQHHYGHVSSNMTGNASATMIGEIRGESELNMITSSLNGGRMGTGGRRNTGGHSSGGYNRTPRTNPLYYNSNGTAERAAQAVSVKGEDLSVSLPYSPIENGRQKHLNGSGGLGGGRYQRRLSLESARTLSDSSSDTEGELFRRENLLNNKIGKIRSKLLRLKFLVKSK